VHNCKIYCSSENNVAEAEEHKSLGDPKLKLKKIQLKPDPTSNYV
jgi:hypothetical protein